MGRQRRQSLGELRRRLWSQLYQRVGGEKSILRATIEALPSRLEGSVDADSDAEPRGDAATRRRGGAVADDRTDSR